MDDEIEKDGPKIYADNNSIVVGEINIQGNVTGNITIGHTIVQPADARLRHELGILLKNVQTTWIKGVLEKSVHEAALLELGLELREEAVDNPWRMVMEAPDQTRETLPRGRRIKDIFDEANRLLLILGEPGSGKTTTLLQLARDLIADVDSAFTQPVPVILNLSTWTNQQQLFDEWMIVELNSKYSVPKKDGQRWLRERRILPLLDGLDEVRAENRAACVERINQLVMDYGLQGLVVCSRFKEYITLNVRLGFYRAIYIQPLTYEQVDEYLNEAGDKLASLRSTLQADEALRSMAQSPLILNIMSLAYQDTSAEDLSSTNLVTDEARRKHLFDIYIARMFNRKAGTRTYEDEPTKQYISWLARNMQSHNQEVFQIEGLQPSWLLARRWQWIYFLGSRLISSLFVGFIALVMYSTFLHLDLTEIWLFVTWIFIALSGLSIGLIDNLRFEWVRKRKGVKYSSVYWREFAIVGLISGLITGLIPIIAFGPDYNKLGVGLLFGIFCGGIFGSRGSRQNPENDIQTFESAQWSWRKALKNGLGVGLITGLTFGLIGGLLDGLFSGLRTGLIVGLIAALLAAFISGLSWEIVESKSIANQGIWLSIRNAIFGGLLLGPLVGFLTGVSGESVSRVVSSPIVGWDDAPRVGLLYILLGALWYGGLDVIQHYILRLILLIQGHTPANYVRFLDYAVDRIFLQKVGGGYRFIHRLLLEHFAEMGEVKKT